MQSSNNNNNCNNTISSDNVTRKKSELLTGTQIRLNIKLLNQITDCNELNISIGCYDTCLSNVLYFINQYSIVYNELIVIFPQLIELLTISTNYSFILQSDSCNKLLKCLLFCLQHDTSHDNSNNNCNNMSDENETKQSINGTNNSIAISTAIYDACTIIDYGNNNNNKYSILAVIESAISTVTKLYIPKLGTTTANLENNEDNIEFIHNHPKFIFANEFITEISMDFYFMSRIPLNIRLKLYELRPASFDQYLFSTIMKLTTQQLILDNEFHQNMNQLFCIDNNTTNANTSSPKVMRLLQYSIDKLLTLLLESSHSLVLRMLNWCNYKLYRENNQYKLISNIESLNPLITLLRDKPNFNSLKQLIHWLKPIWTNNADSNNVLKFDSLEQRNDIITQVWILLLKHANWIHLSLFAVACSNNENVKKLIPDLDLIDLFHLITFFYSPKTYNKSSNDSDNNGENNNSSMDIFDWLKCAYNLLTTLTSGSEIVFEQLFRDHSKYFTGIYDCPLINYFLFWFLGLNNNKDIATNYITVLLRFKQSNITDKSQRIELDFNFTSELCVVVQEFLSLLPTQAELINNTGNSNYAYYPELIRLTGICFYYGRCIGAVTRDGIYQYRSDNTITMRYNSLKSQLADVLTQLKQANEIFNPK